MRKHYRVRLDVQINLVVERLTNRMYRLSRKKRISSSPEAVEQSGLNSADESDVTILSSWSKHGKCLDILVKVYDYLSGPDLVLNRIEKRVQAKIYPIMLREGLIKKVA